MNKYLTLIPFLLLTFITGCEYGYKSSAKAASPNNESQRAANPYLAYEHSISITSTHETLVENYKKITDACAADRANNCAILQSELNSGSYASANVQLRVAPDGVEPLLNLVTQLGEVASQSIKIEDLSIAVADSEQRLSMLTKYQQQIIELQNQKPITIDSAIKIAQEIASIQSQLEDAGAASRYLQQRIKMDIVNISFTTRYEESFWPQISDALSEFSGDLSEGIANTITGIAYLLPWTVLFYLLFLVCKLLWKRRK